MSLIEEFKAFAMRGNVVDMAVGVITGGAFGKIVTSLVTDVIMPPLGYILAGIKFDSLSYKLPEMTIKVPSVDKPGELVDKTLEAVTISYGKFLQAGFDFLIVAICIFAAIKLMNRLKKKEEAAPAPPPPDVALLSEIRDLLKAAKREGT